MPIIEFLDRSGATESFREAVQQFLRTGRPNEQVIFDSHCPAVKVERMLTKLLEAHADLAIDRVAVDAASGCEFFRGTATVDTTERELLVRFEWNCRWKAEQVGWKDWFGLPDQARAAREFGHDCFSRWDVQPVAATTAV